MGAIICLLPILADASELQINDETLLALREAFKASYTKVNIDTLPIEKVHNICLPTTVAAEVFAHAVEVAMKYDKHENKLTGCLLVLGNRKELKVRIQRMRSLEPSSLAGERIQDLRELCRRWSHGD